MIKIFRGYVDKLHDLTPLKATNKHNVTKMSGHYVFI